MKTKIAIIITMLLLTMSAYGTGKVYNYRLYDVRDTKFDSKGNILSGEKKLTNCKYLRFSYSAPLPGQSDVLMFIFEETPNASGVSRLPSIWFEKGKTFYNYRRMRDGDGTGYRELTLYSDDFPNESLRILIQSDYKGKTWVGIQSNLKLTAGLLSSSDSAAFFKMVARLVRDLKIPKAKGSLYIDVDF